MGEKNGMGVSNDHPLLLCLHVGGRESMKNMSDRDRVHGNPLRSCPPLLSTLKPSITKPLGPARLDSFPFPQVIALKQNNS